MNAIKSETRAAMRKLQNSVNAISEAVNRDDVDAAFAIYVNDLGPELYKFGQSLAGDLNLLALEQKARRS